LKVKRRKGHESFAKDIFYIFKNQRETELKKNNNGLGPKRVSKTLNNQKKNESSVLCVIWVRLTVRLTSFFTKT
jgi:hypothetical protein